MAKKACRHRKTWLMGREQTIVEWCYACGAIRWMEVKGSTQCRPCTTWCAPVGDKAENPFDDWCRRSEAYRRRYFAVPTQES